LRKTINVNKYARICGGVVVGTLSAIRELRIGEEVEIFIENNKEKLREFAQVIETLRKFKIIEIIEWKEPNRVVLRRIKTLI